MTQRLVVGIFPQPDSHAIETALAAQNIDLSKVKVVSTSAPGGDSSNLTFVDVANEMESNSLADDLTQHTGVLNDTGTSVPGINSPPMRLDSFESSAPEAPHYLAGFDVPDDEVDNFDEAIAEGRAVVLYADPPDADAVSAAFRAAGLKNVRAY